MEIKISILKNHSLPWKNFPWRSIWNAPESLTKKSSSSLLKVNRGEIYERNCCVKKNFLLSDYTTAQLLPFEKRIFTRR